MTVDKGDKDLLKVSQGLSYLHKEIGWQKYHN